MNLTTSQHHHDSRFSSLKVERSEAGLLRICLARPLVRNAFHAGMVEELTTAFSGNWDCMRLVLLEGEGAVFSAGADLQEMRSLGELSREENLQNAQHLANMFYAVASCPVPVVCVVRGAAVGGAVGLAACADIVISDAEAFFATPECRLGLVPATISPYLVRKMGVSAASYLVFSGRRVSANEAQRLGLVQQVVQEGADELCAATKSLCRDILAAGPEATRSTKALFLAAAPLPKEPLIRYTAQTLAEARESEEARKRIAAFLAGSKH